MAEFQNSFEQGTLLENRYRVFDELGRGTSGLVLRCIDEDTGKEVAVKTLIDPTPVYLHSLKHEFRALVDVSLRHTNLVRFYGLYAESNPYFLTMELLQGKNLLEYVWQDNHFPGISLELEKRIASVFSQLCVGVEALHGEQVLHRDIKPNNIIMTDEGRAVLLDFGLSAELSINSARTMGVGTPKYWAPEQVMGAPVAASDWFSVGATLFHALSGYPIPQTHYLAARQNQWDFLEVIPDSFRSCLKSLLDIEPHSRGDGALLQKILSDTAYRKPNPPKPIVQLEQPFIGRSRELGELFDFQQRSSGAPRVTKVYGESGVGKSELVRRFLEQRELDGAIVLKGKCRPNEVVNFRAIDPLVDMLVNRLARMPEHQVSQLVPRIRYSQPLLAQFPVFGMVEVFDRVERLQFVLDPYEISNRAVAGLREVIARLSDIHPIVMWIDDVQWADANSLNALRELVKPPDAPAIHLILSYRDTQDASSFLNGINKVQKDYDIANQDLELAPLGESDSLALARSLSTEVGLEFVARVATETMGLPFLIGEVVRYCNEKGELEPDIGLESMLSRRMASLTNDQRHLVEAVCVANHPLPREIVSAGVNYSEDAVHELSSLGFLRTTKQEILDGVLVLEAYHDRLRETVVGLLEEDRRTQLHAQIALNMAAQEEPDAALCAEHFAAAHLISEAAEFSIKAGHEAMQVFAFDQAVERFRFALKHYGEEADFDLRQIYSWALKASGSCVESARQMENTLTYAPEGTDQTQLHMFCAEAYTKGANTREAKRVLSNLLPDIGFRMESGKRLALFWAQYYRLGNLSRIYFRGIDKPDDDKKPDGYDINSMLEIIVSMHSLNHLEADVLAVQNVRETLRRGNRFERWKVLTHESVRLAAIGGRYRTISRKVLKDALAIYRDHVLKDEVNRGFACWCIANVHYFLGEWETSMPWWRRARRQLKFYGDTLWLVSWMDIFHSTPFTFKGMFSEMDENAIRGMANAEAAGDLWGQSYYDTAVTPMVNIAKDKPEEALRRMAEGIKRVEANGITDIHIYFGIVGTRVHLYNQDVDGALNHIAGLWQGLDQGGNFELEMYAYLLRFEYIKALLAVARNNAASSLGLVTRAKKELNYLNSYDQLPARPLALSAAAGIALVEGKQAQAAEFILSSLPLYDKATMPLMVEVSYFMLDELGVPSTDQKAVARKWLEDHGVANPERFAHAMLPF